jgi:hypothetical protein
MMVVCFFMAKMDTLKSLSRKWLQNMDLKLKNSVKEYITVNTLRCNTFIEKSYRSVYNKNIPMFPQREGVN